MEYLYDLLVSAFTKFQAAGLSLDRARLGLHGWWVVKGSEQPVPESDSQFDRALVCEAAWAQHCEQWPNPYSDLVTFYEAGASLGRWENHILDVFGPSGEKLWGVPLRSLVDAATKC